MGETARKRSGKLVRKCIATILAVVMVLSGLYRINMERKEAADGNVQTYDMYLNDPEISSGSYLSNLDKYHYIFRLGLAGPGLTAWDYSTGKGIKAAVIDSGANVNHRDLAGNVAGGYNAVSKTEGINCVTDGDGHGSIIAGILGGVGNNGFGSSGVAPEVDLYVVKTEDDQGDVYAAAIAEGIRWAVDEGCRVISISLSSENYNEKYEDAIEYAAAHDVVVVCSGGNTGTSALRYPAAYDGTIGVSALNYDASTGYTIIDSCTHNDDIDVAAPGSGLYGVSKNNNTELAAGGLTSAAAPYVAGVAALILSADPTINAQECEQIIKETATDAGATGYDEWYGHGIINPLAAVQRAKLKQTSISRSISGIASSYTKKLSAGTFQLNPKTEGSGVFSYSSSKPSVASVDANGKVTLKKEGTTSITVSVGLSGIYQPASVTTKLTVTGNSSDKKSDKKQSEKTGSKALKKVKGVKLAAGRRSITVRWNRNDRADGYQVWIARNKKFTKGKKTVLIKKNKKVKKTIRKLKNKKYYVKIRTFKKSSTGKIFGKFSKVKKVKIR